MTEGTIYDKVYELFDIVIMWAQRAGIL